MSLHTLENDDIISTVMLFLHRKSIVPLSIVSTACCELVTKHNTQQLYWRKAKLLLNKIPDYDPDLNHNWKLTHELLATSSTALLLTGTEIDASIASSLGEATFYETAADVRAYARACVIKKRLRALELLSQHEEYSKIFFTQQCCRLICRAAACADVARVAENERVMELVDACGPGFTALIVELACDNNSVEFLRVFLKNHKVANQTHLRLSEHIRNGQYGVVKLLLNHGGITDSYIVKFGMNTACRYGHANIVKLFLSRDALKQMESFEFATISPAARAGNVEIVELFLVDPRVKQEERIDSMYDACAVGRLAVVKVLLTDDYIRERFNIYACLDNAVLNNHVKTVKFLLEYAANNPTKEILTLQMTQLRKLAKENGDEQMQALFN